MKNQPNYVTTLVLKSKEKDMRIDEAMLALFPFAEWNEIPTSAIFESPSLSRLLISVYFENGDTIKRDYEHEFEVLSEQSVQFRFISDARPKLCKECIKNLTPNDTFILYSFERKSLNE